jgi:2-polyprenyl-3-methyl-5-hydroxy-6-metoxy-1,4-benzoquinol methylase
MKTVELPELIVPPEVLAEDPPDLLRYWYLGSRARRYMARRRFREVDRHLPPPPARVLDVGSAWGFNPIALARLGYETVALDLETRPFAAARRIAEANRVSFRGVGGDVSALPFPDRTFDAVTLVETLEHVFEADRARAIAECFRVLKPGGRLLLSTPNARGLVERLKRWVGKHRWARERLPVMCYPAEETDRRSYHPYRYHLPVAPERLERLMAEAGFRVLRRGTFLFVLKNTADVLFPVVRAGEWLAERLPGLRGWAATLWILAERPR